MIWFDDVLSDPDIGTGSFLVTRPGTPTYVDGVEYPGVPTTFMTGPSSLQAAGGQQIRVLPEGLQPGQVAEIFTGADLRAGALPGTAGPPPDILTVTGAEHPLLAHWIGDWIVYSAQRFVAHGSAHTRASLAKVP